MIKQKDRTMLVRAVIFDLDGTLLDSAPLIGTILNRMIYTKGGWAFFNGKESFSTNAAFTVGSSVSTFSGWTLGGGYEYMFAPNWSAKLEYQHDGASATVKTRGPRGSKLDADRESKLEAD